MTILTFLDECPRISITLRRRCARLPAALSPRCSLRLIDVLLGAESSPFVVRPVLLERKKSITDARRDLELDLVRGSESPCGPASPLSTLVSTLCTDRNISSMLARRLRPWEGGCSDFVRSTGTDMASGNGTAPASPTSLSESICCAAAMPKVLRKDDRRERAPDADGPAMPCKVISRLGAADDCWLGPPDLKPRKSAIEPRRALRPVDAVLARSNVLGGRALRLAACRAVCSSVSRSISSAGSIAKDSEPLREERGNCARLRKGKSLAPERLNSSLPDELGSPSAEERWWGIRSPSLPPTDARKLGHNRAVYLGTYILCEYICNTY
ncbi:hypothetical protein Vafri_3466, partial [Volvox africanus]